MIFGGKSIGGKVIGGIFVGGNHIFGIDWWKLLLAESQVSGKATKRPKCLYLLEKNSLSISP